MKRTFLATAITTLALVAGALVGVGLLTERAAMAEPPCPSSWPERDYEGIYTDDAGQEWFIVRSADSNGYHTVRAYPASSSYQTGYAINSPDAPCYLRVRRAGEATDLAEPQRLDFPKEREPASERPAQTPSRPLTLVELLNRLSPSDRQAALLCMLPLAGNRTLAELNNDPEFLRQVIALGCLTP